ncbi:MAG: hypothetical protein KDA61_17300, partial [Planctomycetales bacterium]|nr:hypothetical protein [Planctomycetales bacterium]
PAGAETEMLLRAFHRDLAANGPSVVRIIRTVLQGWRRYQTHSNSRIRARFAHEAANLPIRYAGVLWAAARDQRISAERRRDIASLLSQIYAEFGWRSRLGAPLAGRYLLRSLRRHELRDAAGWTYEPPTFYEANHPDSPTAHQVVGLAPA